MFPRENNLKIFTVKRNPVFEHSDTLSFALLLAYIILYINDKQFRCSVFTFVQYVLGCSEVKQNARFSLQSKKEGKYQESIQSSTTPDPGHHMGKCQKHKETSHTREPSGEPFPRR